MIRGKINEEKKKKKEKKPGKAPALYHIPALSSNPPQILQKKSNTT